MSRTYDLEKIRLRSKKVRNIISEEPPWFIRYGTMVIASLLTIITIFIYVMRTFLSIHL